MHASNLFVTLTYDQENLPGGDQGVATGSLVKSEVSAFVKRLRKTQVNEDGSLREISFFGCGEYGDRTGRPHYHALLFGVDFSDTESRTDTSGRDFWTSAQLDDVWRKGRTEIGTVSMASASYVAGYVRKKVKKKDYARANPMTGELLEPEFARMSLRPAIGRRWLEKYWRDVYPRDFVVIDGYEAKPPRFYDKWMDMMDEKGGTQERRQVMEDVRDRRYVDAVEKTKYQLRAGEKIAEGRIALFSGRDEI